MFVRFVIVEVVSSSKPYPLFKSIVLEIVPLFVIDVAVDASKLIAVPLARDEAEIVPSFERVVKVDALKRTPSETLLVAVPEIVPVF